jgi:hypothetical protein
MNNLAGARVLLRLARPVMVRRRACDFNYNFLSFRSGYIAEESVLPDTILMAGSPRLTWSHSMLSQIAALGGPYVSG